MTNTYKKVSYHKQIARQHFCQKKMQRLSPVLGMGRG